MPRSRGSMSSLVLAFLGKCSPGDVVGGAAVMLLLLLLVCCSWGGG